MNYRSPTTKDDVALWLCIAIVILLFEYAAWGYSPG
jgi:hypothetical protein